VAVTGAAAAAAAIAAAAVVAAVATAAVVDGERYSEVVITVFIEVTNGPRNWGKFAVCRFEYEEWGRPSQVEAELGVDRSLLRACGWGRDHVWVLDMQTGEGAYLRPGGSASADLMKHQVWVCPMFEPFLVWLYQQDLTDLKALPSLVDLPDAPFAFQGYRRPGPQP
jgi:hypothetical protein